MALHVTEPHTTANVHSTARRLATVSGNLHWCRRSWRCTSPSCTQKQLRLNTCCTLCCPQHRKAPRNRRRRHQWCRRNWRCTTPSCTRPQLTLSCTSTKLLGCFSISHTQLLGCFSICTGVEEDGIARHRAAHNCERTRVAHSVAHRTARCLTTVSGVTSVSHRAAPPTGTAKPARGSVSH